MKRAVEQIREIPQGVAHENYDIGMERVVLGAVLLDKEAISLVLDIISPKVFYYKPHQEIFKAALSLFSKSAPIDLMTITDELKKQGLLEEIGGPYYLVELTNYVASAANIEYHSRILAQYFIKRELMQLNLLSARKCADPSIDVFDLLSEVEEGIYSVVSTLLNRGFESASQGVASVLRRLEEISKNPKGLTGIPSGFTEVDRLTNGWQNTDLIVIAARPGMGKTSLECCMAINSAILYDKHVVIFSLEMSKMQMWMRLISIEAEIPSSKLRSALLEEAEWQQMQSASEKLSVDKIHIDDTPSIGVFELRSKCRRMKSQGKLDMVLIDYLQLMTGSEKKKGNREQEISEISRSLKALAKELEVPVIAFSQLSRAVETRGGSKRPQLSDLRESGAIEQDADIVTFIYRPEYYNILEDEEGQSLRGIAELIFAKHRNGSLKTIKLKFTDKYTRFSDLDDPNFSELTSDINPYGSNIITRSDKMNDDDIPW